MIYHNALLVLLAFLGDVRCHPCDIRSSEEYGGPLADCSGRGLTSVPSDLPSDLAALDLSSNNISVIQNLTFRNFTNMKFLDFSCNFLKTLEAMTFYGLSKLQSLNLNGNKLQSNYNSFPLGVFNSLVNLQTLWLEQEDFDTSYPDWIFLPLSKLERLFIDSVEMPQFGKGFSNLVKLEYLQMDGHGNSKGSLCSLVMLKNNTFEAFRNISLKTLNVSHCWNIFSVETGLFEPLRFLETLIFSNMDIGIHQSLQLLKPFVGRKMKKIDLSSIYPHHKPLLPNALDSFLKENDTEFLRKICVKEFIYSKNNVVYITESALFGNPFSECLITLDLSKNALIGDIRVFFKLQKFTRIKTLLFGKVSFNQFKTENGLENQNKTISLLLPETLEVFVVSGLLNKDSPLDLGSISLLELLNTKRLKQLRINNNDFPGKLKFKGIENVEELDLSYNNIENIRHISFESFTKLKILLLRGCSLRIGEQGRNDLTNFPYVQVLDLSQNILSQFPVLANPQTARLLNLSENSFETVPIDLELFPSLQKIDLTFNAISFLSKSERDKISSLHKISGLKLYLRGNTFSCGCKELDLVQWMIETPAVYENDRSFACILDNGTTTDIVKVARNIQFHTRHCRGPTTFILTITFGLLLIIAISGTYAIIKNPTRYQNFILRFLRISGKVSTSDEFSFMLYVAYTSTDIPLVYRELRPALEKHNISLFLKDREVLPGHDIADGISEGINNSWKILLVVSWDFLNDPWSTFIINSALYSMTELITNRIIILLVDGVQLGDLPDTLLTAVDEDLVLDYDSTKGHSHLNELIQLL